MATGDVTIFEEFLVDLRDKIFDFDTDTWKLGIIDNSTPPTAADATPRWADYSGNEVATAGNYTANGETLGSVTCAEAAGVMTFDAADVTISQDGSGFTDGYWGIIYSDTAAADQAMAFVEMGGPVSEQAGDVTFEWNASGIATFTVNP